MGAEFENRLAKIQQQREAAGTRSTQKVQPFQPDGSKTYEKKDNPNFWPNLIRMSGFAIVALVSLRIFAIINQYDLEDRLRTLQPGSIQYKTAQVAISAFQVADPILMPLLGFPAPTTPKGRTGFTKVAESKKPETPITIERDHGLEPIPTEQSFIGSLLTKWQVKYEYDPTKYFPPAPEGWFRLTEEVLRHEATPYYAQKSAWNAEGPKLKPWGSLPFLKAFLSVKGSSEARDNQKDFAWYMNPETGEGVFLAIRSIAATGPQIDLSPIAEQLKQFNDDVAVTFNDVTYDVSKLKAKRTLDYHFKGRPTVRYKAIPHPSITIAMYSTADSKTTLEILRQIDMRDAINKNEEDTKFYDDRAKAIGVIPSDEDQNAADITDDSPGKLIQGTAN